MRSVALLAAVVLVGVGVAFVLTGFNREVAPVLLVSGIFWAVVALFPGRPPPRGR